MIQNRAVLNHDHLCHKISDHHRLRIEVEDLRLKGSSVRTADCLVAGWQSLYWRKLDDGDCLTSKRAKTCSWMLMVLYGIDYDEVIGFCDPVSRSEFNILCTMRTEGEPWKLFNIMFHTVCAETVQHEQARRHVSEFPKNIFIEG